MEHEHGIPPGSDVLAYDIGKKKDDAVELLGKGIYVRSSLKHLINRCRKDENSHLDEYIIRKAEKDLKLEKRKVRIGASVTTYYLLDDVRLILGYLHEKGLIKDCTEEDAIKDLKQITLWLQSLKYY